MKKLLPLIFSISLFACKKESGTTNPPSTTIDSANVTVTNGYGSGTYKVGDTVHIFSLAISDNQLFDSWTSTDVALLNGKDEWHTWFIMPARNLNFVGSIKTITPFTVTLEQIMGRDRLKPVYYFFPAGHKGFVYLLHGSGGTAQNLATNFEWKQLMKDLVANNYGFIIT